MSFIPWACRSAGAVSVASRLESEMSAVSSSPPSAAGTGGASGAAFVRKSSGLIKSGTPWRVFVMAFAVQGVGAWMALYYLYGIGPFPRANIWLAFLLMLPLTQAFNLALSLLASAYPRDG